MSRLTLLVLTIGALLTTPGCAKSPIDGGRGAVPPALRPLPVGSEPRRCLVDFDPLAIPAEVAATGCFELSDLTSPVNELIHLAVRSPLHTDHAVKDRYLLLPDDGAMPAVVEGEDEISLPEGAALLKVFSYHFPGESEATPIEVRFVTRFGGVDQIFGYSLATTSAGRPSGPLRYTLVDQPRVLPLDIVVDDESLLIEYSVPGRAECGFCHLRGLALPYLGFRGDQLDLDVERDGEVENQLDALLDVGLMIGRGSDEIDELVDPLDRTQSPEARARSYLAANCSHCHSPHGWAGGSVPIDLRPHIRFADMGLCEVPTSSAVSGVGALFVPGDAESSALVDRVRREDAGRMPSLGTALLDATAALVLTEWISETAGCP